METEWIKPPIGVNPHWFVYKQRIIELSKAIERYAEFVDKESSGNTGTAEYYELISKWAYDLYKISKLEYELLKIDRGLKDA